MTVLYVGKYELLELVLRYVNFTEALSQKTVVQITHGSRRVAAAVAAYSIHTLCIIVRIDFLRQRIFKPKAVCTGN